MKAEKIVGTPVWDTVREKWTQTTQHRQAGVLVGVEVVEVGHPETGVLRMPPAGVETRPHRRSRGVRR